MASLAERHVQRIMAGNKTVYLLGAGASNASSFGLPTMEKFFEKDSLSLNGFPDLKKFIDRHFPDTSVEKLNLEDIITYLELSMDRFGSLGMRPDVYLRDARKQFNQYVSRRLTYPSVNGSYACSTFERLFQKLKHSDTVITLNYDLVMERVLEKNFRYDKLVELLNPTIRATGPMGAYKWEFENGWYLKLHGSIDWFYCSNPKCFGHQFMNVREPSWKYVPPSCNTCGAVMQLAIVPPTMHKVFGEYPRLGALWSLAHQELASSTSIVIVGISFRPSDYYLAWLMKSSCMGGERKDPLVVVIDKNKEILNRVQELVGRKPVYCKSLKAYISVLSAIGNVRENKPRETKS